tara:strand:+ start:2167 stop:2808 length:642 start_codon:yes stop_codon:yes gene_type:complete
MNEQQKKILRQIKHERTRKIELIMEKSDIDSKVAIEYVKHLNDAYYSMVSSHFTYTSIGELLSFFYFLDTDENNRFDSVYNTFMYQAIFTNKDFNNILGASSNLFVASLKDKMSGKRWFIGQHVNGMDYINSTVNGFTFIEFIDPRNLEDRLKVNGMANKEMYISSSGNYIGNVLSLWYEPDCRKNKLSLLLLDHLEEYVEIEQVKEPNNLPF